MNQQFGPLLYLISIWALPAIVAITLHEAAHGFAARLLGDDTAWRLGRVSFNPLKHIDPIGTILLRAMLLLLRSPFLFGYAKPVPVKPRHQAQRPGKLHLARRFSTHSGENLISQRKGYERFSIPREMLIILLMAHPCVRNVSVYSFVVLPLVSAT